ncbi:MAG TPA: ATP-binding protein [Gemmatimonadaceae bacterium]|nr:ATP-binding protein [Gemmatimonadaceae bacterium]
MLRTAEVDTTPPQGDSVADVYAALGLLADIVDTVREPLLVLDPDLRVTHANRSFFTTFQVEPEQTIGQVIFALGNGQWDIPPLHTLLHDTLPTHTQLADLDVDHVFPGIGRKIMLLNARLVTSGRSGLRMILLAIEDVTERRRVEHQFAAQRRELQRSNTALEAFAAVASHDLQEPLRKILAFGERLQATAGPALDGNGRGYLDRMLNAAARMRRLITDLLAYARVTTRAEPFVRVDLAELAGEVMADLETSIAESGGVVEVGALPTIDADPLQIRQLLQNLVSNALKYRNVAVPLVVRLDARADGDRCILTVADNGIGFGPQYAERIFGMFERLHGRMEYEGSGIGLAICRSIVEHHGGTITAAGAPGQGAVFSVALPFAQLPLPEL